jgi:hypothetical protein
MDDLPMVVQRKGYRGAQGSVSCLQDDSQFSTGYSKSVRIVEPLLLLEH